MEVTTKGAIALKQLRQKLQEDANGEFPKAVMRELLILHDVCKSLDLNVFQAKEVLGNSGWQGVVGHLNSPACRDINWERINQLSNTSNLG